MCRRLAGRLVPCYVSAFLMFQHRCQCKDLTLSGKDMATASNLTVGVYL